MKKLIQWGFSVFLLGAITPVFAQLNNWTPEQKTVWKTETDTWEALAHGQFPAQNLDDNFVEWLPNSPVPVPKANKERRNSFNLSLGNKIIFVDFIPVVIWVNGNFAYADYYQATVSQDEKGEKNQDTSRWMDVLMKKDGKWIIVGEMGGFEPESK